MSDNGKIEKNNLIFQLAKLRRLRGISGKFISASSQYNKRDRYELFEFIQKSLESFMSSELLSPTFYQLASNAFEKINNIEETIDTLQYLEEWIGKIESSSLSEADKYFCKVYSYDVYMGDLNNENVCRNLKKMQNLDFEEKW